MNATDSQRLREIARRVMRQRGLEPDFPAAALDQLALIREAASAQPGPHVLDLRERLWASIDNDDSRDLDQLTVAEELAAGAVKIFVAIADVDALVQRGTPLDAHARANTTSVYTAAQTFPMLPERLSTDLTSLAENQDRLALVVDMTLSREGALQASDVYMASVKNHAKLTYAEVGAWLGGTASAPERVSAVPGLDRQLRIQDRCAQQLREARQARGALTLESIEARPVFDRGSLRDFRPDPSNRAHELIEDFMIAANGVTARYLASRGWPSLRRILRTPRKWGRIVEIAAQLGETLPPEPSAIALNTFLLKRRSAAPASFADLSLCIIKLLGRGEYTLDLPSQPSPAHFGLAVDDYTHSTAPNRRFPDLLTQRLLKAALASMKSEYSVEELTALAEHCTLQEDNAAKVERQVSKSAAALLLQARLGEQFEGIVTGAADKGTWVRITSPTVEGRLVAGYAGLDVGDRVRVKLQHTDVDRGFIDFERSA